MIAQRNISRNIWKLYVLNALYGAIFLIPVIIPFYRENGVSLAQALLLEAIFSIEMVILEIPTGYLSDRWGRKPTIVIAYAFSILGWLQYGVGTGFNFFLIGEILMGVGASLLSGTGEAMTYDTLLEMGETARYRHISGNQNFSMFTTEALCSILGGILAIVSLRTAAWVTVASPIFGFLVALTLTEPHRHKLQGTQHLRTLWRISTNTLVHNIPLRSITLLHGLISTMTLSLFWLTQPFQTMVHLPLALFGITHALIVGSGAVAARYTHAISKHIDDRFFLLLIALAVVISYIVLGFSASLWAMLFFFTGRIGWGLLSPLTSDLMNRMTTSDIRATVLSIRALASRLLFAMTSPFIGYAADVWPLNQALLLVGCIGGIALTIIFLLMRPVWGRIPK